MGISCLQLQRSQKPTHRHTTVRCRQTTGPHFNAVPMRDAFTSQHILQMWNLAKERASSSHGFLCVIVLFTFFADRRSEVGIISWERSWAGANIWKWPHVASDRPLVRLNGVSLSFSVFFFFLHLDHNHSLIAFSNDDGQIPHDSFSSATADQMITDVLGIASTKQAFCSES